MPISQLNCFDQLNFTELAKIRSRLLRLRGFNPKMNLTLIIKLVKTEHNF